MTARPFNKGPSPDPPPVAHPELPDGQPHGDEGKERAAAELLQYEVLRHTFGQAGEYEVRTRITTRQSWQYRCDVLYHGKAIKQAFPPIVVDRMPQMRPTRLQPGVARAMRLSFAREAVETHFTRCATLQEYLRMAMIYSQPPPNSGPRYHVWILLIGAAFLTAYGLWTQAPWTTSGRPTGSTTSTVQEMPSPAVDRRPGEPRQSIPLPPGTGTASRDLIDEPAAAPPFTEPAGTARAVRLTDLLALEHLPERAHPASRTPTPRLPSGSTASDVREGDLLLLTGWVHRISRAADSAYHMQVSASPKAAAPGLIAVVPPPDQVSGSQAMRAQLQSVRAFIKQRLLRQQEPSPQGSVIRRPVFVQLTGHLSHPNGSADEPSRGKVQRDPTPRWEVRPVLEMGLATVPAPSERSRPR